MSEVQVKVSVRPLEVIMEEVPVEVLQIITQEVEEEHLMCVKVVVHLPIVLSPLELEVEDQPKVPITTLTVQVLVQGQVVPMVVVI